MIEHLGVPGISVPLMTALQVYLSQRFPVEQRKNHTTYPDRASRIRCFIDFLKSTGLQENDIPCDQLIVEQAAELIQQFLDYRLLKQLSACTIDNDRRVLSAAFTWLSRNHYVPFKANPASKELVNCPQVVVRCKDSLNASDITKLLVATRDSELYPFIILCVGCGLRPRGASRVTPQHLDITHKTVRVFEKNRERVIPISAWAAEELAAYPQRGNKWVQLHISTITHRLAAIRKSLGWPDYITMQALRRTFIRTLFENHVAPQMAAALCGNSIAVIQRHYVQMETLSAHGVVDCVKFSSSAN